MAIALSAATNHAVTPQSLAAILQVIINSEATEVQIIQALYPNNPLIQAAVNLAPTLLPILQGIENVLAQQPTT